MAPVGLEQGQRHVERTVHIGPTLGPYLLRLRLIPLERELSLLVPQRYLDACLPEIISVDDVMNNLPNCPASLRRRSIQISVVDASKGTHK